MASIGLIRPHLDAAYFYRRSSVVYVSVCVSVDHVREPCKTAVTYKTYIMAAEAELPL